MEDGLIAAVLTLIIILTWGRFEEFQVQKSFNSQLADIIVLNSIEDKYDFDTTQFNQIDSKLEPSVMQNVELPAD